HAAHPRQLGAGPGTGERRDGGGVEVPMWCVIEEVAHGADAQPGQGLGALGADALQELDRCVELQRHQARTSRRANASGSNTSRSPRLSPVATKRGTAAGTDRRNPTTAPPRAVPSSL